MNFVYRYVVVFVVTTQYWMFYCSMVYILVCFLSSCSIIFEYMYFLTKKESYKENVLN